MELIIKTYGRFLIGFLVIAAFLLLLFTGIRDEQGNVGVLKMTGARLSTEPQQWGDEFQISVQESARELPKLFYRRQEALRVGSYDINEIFGALDCEKAKLQLQLRKMEGQQGEIPLDAEELRSGQLVFQQPGIYRVEVCATDRWNQTSVCCFTIPVNGGKA